MKGLLVKDWFMLGKTMKFMVVFLVIYGIIGSFNEADSMRSFFSVFSVVMGSLAVRTLMAYEEQSKWELLAAHLPVTAKQLVVEKYIVGGGCMLFTGTLVTLIQALIRTVTGQQAGYAASHTFLLMLVVGLFTLMLELPVTFKFGVNRGRIWCSLMLGLLVGIGTALGSIIGVPMHGAAVPAPMEHAVLLGLLVLLAAAAVGVFFSIRISIRFYEKREF